jgi:cation diffusion facilitator family transporter
MRAARISVIVTLILIIAKGVAGWLSGSLALISIAADSVFDFLAVLVTLLAVRVTSQPPDEDHLYGHGKFDSLAGLFQSLFLIGVSSWICYTAIGRLSNDIPETLNINTLTLTILFGSFVLDMWRANVLRKVAHESRSQALRADSLHFLADALSVLVAIAGVLFAKFAGIPAADSYAAILVAAFIIYQSLRQGKDAIDSLTDRFPQSDEYKKIHEAIASIAGVESLRLLRMRHSGTLTYVDASVSVNRMLPASAGEKIRSEIDQSIQKILPESETSIAIRPVKTEHESAFETIRLITSEFGILPHNIELSESEEGVIADLHIEFPPERSFEEAHATSEEIEERIREEIPGIEKVYTHLEVERSALSTTPMRDLSVQESHLVEDVRKFIAVIPEVQAVEDIAFYEHRETGELKLVLTVELQSALTLHDAHEIVTDLERKLRKQYPNLGRVVIHTEPSSFHK